VFLLPQCLPATDPKGRKFKELGYRLTADEVGGLLEEGNFPISAIIKARPYDKAQSGGATQGQSKYRNRALHEIEIIVAGSIGEKLSAFFEIEMEDDKIGLIGNDNNPFTPIIGPATLNYNYNEALNLQFMWAPAFFNDPYGVLTPHLRLTRNTNQIINQNWGGTDGSGGLSTFRQQVAVTGRPIDWFFYSLGWSGLAADERGQNANTLIARGVVDATDALGFKEAFGLPIDVAVGGFYLGGENKTGASNDLDFDRYGADINMDIENLRLNATYIRANDDLNEIMDTDTLTHAFMLKAFYVFETEKGNPWIVPLVRFDKYTEPDGTDNQNYYKDLTLNLSYYFAQNARVFFEYYQQLERPAPTDKYLADRYTLQMDVAF